MKRILVGMALLAATLPAFSYAQETAPPKAPKLACEQPEYDFGTADNTQAIEHEFILRNEGNDVLVIGNVRPSCGCTVANITEKNVQPGAETRVLTRLSLQGRAGPQHKTVVVESNDPEKPQFMLNLKGTVGSAVESRPDRIIFGQLGAGGTFGSEIQIVGDGHSAFRVLQAEPSSTNIQVKIETVEEGKVYKLAVNFTAPETEGAFNGFIRVQTDHPARTTLDIPVTGLVMGDLVVAPQELILARGTPSSTRFLIVRSGRNEAFEITGIELPGTDAKSQVFPFGSNGYRIQIENLVPNDALNGTSIKIKTSLGSRPELIVPVRIVDQAQPQG